MSILSLSDAKAALRIPPANTANDTLLAEYVAAVDPIIEDIVGPVNADTRTQTFDGGRAALILASPAASITSVTMFGTALDASQYTANLAAGIVYCGSQQAPATFTPGQQNIVVEYTVGSATVPPNVKLGAMELLRFWWQVGQQGNRPGFGDAPEADAYTPSGFAVPRRVIELCGPNQRMPGIG